jgi:hypothetical protein
MIWLRAIATVMNIILLVVAISNSIDGKDKNVMFGNIYIFIMSILNVWLVWN